MAYIGSSATPMPVAFAAVQSQSFNGTGSQTAFTISRSVPSAASLEVLVNNVQQSPYDGSYSVSGTTLTFSEAPSSGTNNVYVIYRDQALGSLVDQTAYRKSEADTLLAAKVNKAGDTMTGGLFVSGINLTNGPSLGAYGASKFLMQGEDPYTTRGYACGPDASTFGQLQLYRATSTGSPQLALGFDQAGRVRMPSQPMVCMRLTSSKGVGLIAWDEYMVNQGIAYNATTRRFTVPVSGNYRINFNGFKGASSTTSRLYLCKNSDSATGSTAGNIGHIYSDDTNGYDTYCIDVIVSLAANDYFTFNLVEGTLYSAPNDAFNFMNAHLLG